MSHLHTSLELLSLQHWGQKMQTPDEQDPLKICWQATKRVEQKILS